MNTFLVIEDEKLLLNAIQKKLEKNGIKSVGFENGEKALKYINESEENPDVIWLDYYLNGMNGMEFMKKFNQAKHSIPVIVVSNSASEEKVNTMHQLGIKKYFLKAEHTLDAIINEIKKIIPNK